MTVSAIRRVFPEPNQEQESLISASSLALIDKEKAAIDAVNRGVDGYRQDVQVDPTVRLAVDHRIAEAIFNAQLWGGAVGGGVGLVAGGALAWKVCPPISLPHTCGAIGIVAVAAGAGAVAGYYGGEKNRPYACV